MGHDKLRDILYDVFADECEKLEEIMVKRQILWEQQMESNMESSGEWEKNDVQKIDEDKKKQQNELAQ